MKTNRHSVFLSKEDGQLVHKRKLYEAPSTILIDTEPALFICQSVRNGVKFQSSIQVNPLQEIIDEPDDFTFDDFGN